jgi:hypothetical protein
MAVDRMSFLYFVGALAAGGAGGYVLDQQMNAKDRAASDQHTQDMAALDTAHQATANAETAAASAASARLTAAVVCDDSVGTSDCPPSGAPSASDEGICGGGGSVAAKRCGDFKTAFKPRVAAAAASCLKKLSDKQVCDPARANLCGHEALMLACQESPSPNESMVSSVNVSASPPPSAPMSAVASACDAILKGCADAVPGVSLADCYRTLSGMNDVGRANMTTCMRTHCSDKGLLGCEAMAPPNP